MEEKLKQQRNEIIKIAIFGPESTGKTTLAQQLARHYDTVWAAEYARDFLQDKWDGTKVGCQPEDLMPIAIGQTQLENATLLKAKKYLFCDTCLLLTKVYAEINYNSCDPVLDKAARKHKYDLFFLTDIDVPWEKDDLRDSPMDRKKTFDLFKKALIENDKPFIVLSGNAEQRLAKAIKCIDVLTKARELGLNSYDYIQIENKGSSLETIKGQFETFRTGAAKTVLLRAATKGDGIIKLTGEEFESYANYFDRKKSDFKLKKFVPASGAASRMFKFLIEFANEFDLENETINAYINRKNANNLSLFLAGIEKFPFYKDLIAKLEEIYPNYHDWNSDKRKYSFIKLMLDPHYFDYCNKPKGILPFHKYSDHIATPIEEHLNESAFYASSNGIGNLHFTISQAHQDHFEQIIGDVKNKIEGCTGIDINVDYSYQDASTDTIAVDLDNQPFRTEDGKIVFRPAGHGALIENLNRLDSDIVFIKNIDNVSQNHIQLITLNKKALAGILIELQEQIFGFLNQIKNKSITETDIAAIILFVEYRLNISLSEDFSKYTLEHKIEYLSNLLNRPIRVCGMVKNEGEPGGGPFWVVSNKGNVSLQIVESSQIDLKNSEQTKIFKSSTHFNPVDLVCGIRDFNGNKFVLQQFVDKNSGFIVEKNKNGKPLKAYELPGLWNGAMAKWITLFVEVPLSTFNPVKTVNDLLKPAHQPQ